MTFLNTVFWLRIKVALVLNVLNDYFLPLNSLKTIFPRNPSLASSFYSHIFSNNIKLLLKTKFKYLLQTIFGILDTKRSKILGTPQTKAIKSSECNNM